MHAAALLLSLLASPSAQDAGARVEVLEGRALLAGAGAVAHLEAGGPQRSVDGPAHLELPAGSRARVTWSGRASLVLEGRNVLAWQPGGDGAPPGWDLIEVGTAHLELRRGPLDLNLTGAWRARLFSGACSLRGLAGDGVELDHQAGLPFDLWPPERDGAPSAPFTVLAGARVRLLAGTGRPLALQGSQARLRDAHQRLGLEIGGASAGYPAWRGFAWPWAGAPSSASIEVSTPGRNVPALPSPSEFSRSAASAPIEPANTSAAQPVPAAPPEASVDAPQGAPEETKAVSAPEIVSKLRERGVLVLTPYGPRWLDASRAVDPSLRERH